MSNTIFAWGLTKEDVAADVDDLLMADDLLCYRSIASAQGVADTAYPFCNFQHTDLTKPGNGTILNSPTREIYFSTQCTNVLTPTSVKLNVRVVYDVVTLSNAEQAALFRS